MEIEFERRTRKPRPITVISLIDVMFVLLLFFMIAGHLEKTPIVAVDVPKADSGQLLDEGPIDVVLGKYDEILINDELLDETQVLAELKRQLIMNPQRVVTIKADQHLEANKLVRFMEAVNMAGGKNLSLVTQSSGARLP
jgi:biopolymer transport protein ExbD